MFQISSTQKKLGLLIGLIVLAGLGGAIASVFPGASNQGYQPEQPIPFSHRIHAGENQIPCQYCHVAAERSRHATVPALNVCMNCHSVVKTDSPHIQKLTKHYKEGKPVEWIRIHELPDFVYFPHKRHVQKGVSCETCHGDVKTMDKVYQAEPLTMGWCLKCHRGETTPSNVLRTHKPEAKLPEGHVATQNCSACHH